MSRREQKAPAREQPTTGEDTSSPPPGAGEGQGRDEVPRLGAVVVTALLTGGAGTGTAVAAAPVP